MAYIADLEEVEKNLGKVGNKKKDVRKREDYGGESNHCVALVKYFAKAPQTNEWKRGDWVKDMKTIIQPGTAIATFRKYDPIKEKYSYLSESGSHAAIYRSRNAHGIQVYEQWNGQAVQTRTIRWNNPVDGDSNNGDAFYVIK